MTDTEITEIQAQFDALNVSEIDVVVRAYHNAHKRDGLATQMEVLSAQAEKFRECLRNGDAENAVAYGLFCILASASISDKGIRVHRPERIPPPVA